MISFCVIIANFSGSNMLRTKAKGEGHINPPTSKKFSMYSRINSASLSLVGSFDRSCKNREKYKQVNKSKLNK